VYKFHGHLIQGMQGKASDFVVAFNLLDRSLGPTSCLQMVYMPPKKPTIYIQQALERTSIHTPYACNNNLGSYAYCFDVKVVSSSEPTKLMTRKLEPRDDGP